MSDLTPLPKKPHVLYSWRSPAAFTRRPFYIVPIVMALADVEFMQNMIPHHAQAVIMGRWAATHGARADVKILCERIVVAQGDEIRLMRRWLGERNQQVSDSMSTKHQMQMGDMVHDIMTVA